jgi:UDP-N-acetylmuramoylalanine--D-glutamate ligase
MDIQGKRITIIGLGKSGVAIAKLLARNGYQVKITEASDRPMLRPWAEEMHKIGVSVELGGHREDFYSDAEWVIPCPGVKPNAAPLQWARQKKIPIYSEMEIAYRYAPCPIIGITGTNGKTTTTTLVGEILKNAGWQVSVGGNIGAPLSAFVDQLMPRHWVVLEISSFQLEYIERFRPKIAAFLNFTANHLDHHQNIAEYFAMKNRITECQTEDDLLVLNAEDPWSEKVVNKSKARVFFFNNGRDREYANDNYKAAALIARILGIPKAIIDQTLLDFKGIEHRLEEVAVLDGIRFINDSKSTSVASLRWALRNVPAPIHLIVGGRDKGGDFGELNPLIQEKVRRVLLIGESTQKLQRAWRESGVSVETAVSLKEAVVLAHQEAEAGTSVLLSPGCASFDMFENYEDRGRQFKAIVHRLDEEITAHADRK